MDHGLKAMALKVRSFDYDALRALKEGRDTEYGEWEERAEWGEREEGEVWGAWEVWKVWGCGKFGKGPEEEKHKT